MSMNKDVPNLKFCLRSAPCQLTIAHAARLHHSFGASEATRPAAAELRRGRPIERKEGIATSARSAAAGSRSARAQKSQVFAALAMAPGPCARIASIV